MSRIRSIHAAFFSDEHIIQASPWARLLLIGLLTQADDQGVFEWKPRQIRLDLFPEQQVDIDAMLRELMDLDRVRSFEDDGYRYGVIRNFGEYQKPKKPSYRFPLPPALAGYAGFKGGQPPKAGKGSPIAASTIEEATDDAVEIPQVRGGKSGHGDKSTTYNPSSTPLPGGSTPPPGGGSPSRGEERREEKKVVAVRSSLAPPRAMPPPANDRGANDRIGASDAACRPLIAAFDDALAAEWGQMARRPVVHGRDYPTARAWLELGATPEIVADVAKRVMPGMHARDFVPKLVSTIDNEVRAALADRQRRATEGPADPERDRWLPRMSAYLRGNWLANWGEPPGQVGCDMPRRLQDEVLKSKAG